MAAELKTFDLPSQTEEWLKWRKTGVTATDIPQILGLSPWGNALDVWLNKKNVSSTKFQSEQMSWGQKLEPLIVSTHAEQTGLNLLLSPCYQDGYYLASLDAIGTTQTGDKINIEAKTDSRSSGWFTVPQHYRLQCQWQMFVSGLEVTDLTVLHRGSTLVAHRVERDDEMIGLLKTVADDFWVHYVQNDVRPDVAPTLSQANLMWPDSTKEKVELSDEDFAVVKQLKEVKEQLKELQAKEKEYQAHIATVLGSCSVGTKDGQDIVTWNTQTRSNFDKKLFESENKDLAQKYTGSTKMRVMRLKQKNLEEETLL